VLRRIRERKVENQESFPRLLRSVEGRRRGHLSPQAGPIGIRQAAVSGHPLLATDAVAGQGCTALIGGGGYNKGGRTRSLVITRLEVHRPCFGDLQAAEMDD